MSFHLRVLGVHSCHLRFGVIVAKKQYCQPLYFRFFFVPS